MTPQQIETNYMESFQFLLARKKRQVAQLVLLNNLQRKDQTIASTLMITLFNRVLSALYDDKMQVKFLPSQGINQDQLNSFNTLAQSDYLEMGKAKLDYDWCWDTLFFGRGYCETYQFDKKQKIMRPHIINPLVFGYDPYFEDPQQWRYYWKWLTKSGHEIRQYIKAGKITGIKKPEDIRGGIDSYLWEYKTQRDAAAKGVQPPIEPAAADVYQILEYFGYDEEGNKCIYWLDKDFSRILMKEKLELDDSEDVTGEKSSKWPITIKESFRIPHASLPVSIADILEDKHRAKSVLLNLAFIAAKDRANPIYGYNPDKVRDVTQFLARQINQHIPMDDADAAWPLNTQEPMSAGLIQFITMLQQEANDPVGTGVQLEPHAGGTQTATEVAIDQQLNDLAQSLSSKVLQFGEADFWSHWFHRYQKNGKDLESKIANVVGVKGVESTEVFFKDFQTKYPPGVLVYSAKEAEYKELVQRRDLMQILPDLQATMDPDGIRNFYKHVFFPKFLQDPSLIEVLFPKTLEEIKAEEQNEMLKRGEMPPVIESDDDSTHLYTHRMLSPKNWATWLHIAEHEEQLAKKQAQLQAQQQAEQAAQPATQQAPPGGGGQKQGITKSQESAAPLKEAAKTPLNK